MTVGWTPAYNLFDSWEHAQNYLRRQSFLAKPDNTMIVRTWRGLQEAADIQLECLSSGITSSDVLWPWWCLPCLCPPVPQCPTRLQCLTFEMNWARVVHCPSLAVSQHHI